VAFSIISVELHEFCYQKSRYSLCGRQILSVEILQYIQSRKNVLEKKIVAIKGMCIK